ncbi:arsinothricin resistance N-acetyltransferase ArsN1 family B [Ktedonospora formicarum]|uniref:N-acetyltransferase n=1 Tax=Ktedonospora formicarum TaxID=2778364 RepID=A0A8J3I986_9CHLR|nr:arsinothricin resistance N-acetyltransferase ArsN1 family B [Ktedonospora formicarum]GHO47004.1 N-acetyltransferase [Ktedonospora formicarum]
MSQRIRLARAKDAQAIQDIYAPIVSHTPISFETTPPSIDEIQRRIEHTLTKFPWLVYEDADRLSGYAYASQHRTRAAYQWAVDVSVYVHEQSRHRGIGRRLYTALFQLLRQQGFYNAYAGITLPNAGSVALHEAMGMRPLGVYHKVGYKLGTWHDVGWWQGELQPHSNNPHAPKSMAEMDIFIWEEHIL